MPYVTLENTNNCVSELTHGTKIRSLCDAFKAEASFGPKPSVCLTPQRYVKMGRQPSTLYGNFRVLHSRDSAGLWAANYKRILNV